jgi:hypothetical protein
MFVQQKHDMTAAAWWAGATRVINSDPEERTAHMSKNGIRLGAAALTTAAVLGAGSAAAGAATPTPGGQSLSTIQAKAAAAISLRVNDLNVAVTTVDARKDLGTDSATLAAYLQADIAPLQALGQKIAGDTSPSTAAADAATIFTNFRVLALVLPAARLAATADGIDVTIVPKLTALSAKATSRVNPSNAATVQPLINDLNAQISAATNDTSGVASAVLGDLPVQWNANHSLLAPSLGSVKAAKGDVTKALADVAQLRSDLTPTKAPTSAS